MKALCANLRNGNESTLEPTIGGNRALLDGKDVIDPDSRSGCDRGRVTRVGAIPPCGSGW